MTSSPGYSLRPAQDADKPSILAMLRALAPHLDPVKRWEWIYEQNPAGRAITWVAVDEAAGEIAGVTSYFPVRLWVSGEVVKGALGGDGYVPPKFRRRGIAGALHAALRAEMPAHQIEVMFGAPAAANQSPLEAGGSRVIGDIVRFVRPLTASAVSKHAAFADGLARLLLAPAGGSARLDPVAPSDSRIDDVWKATRPELGIATVRDAVHYEWRFSRGPTQVQRAYLVLDGRRPIGTCVLQERQGKMHIVDLCAPRREWPAVVAAIARAASHCHALEITLVREDGQRRRLSEYGFIERDSRPYLIVTPEDSTRTELFHDPNLWTYMSSDIDVDVVQ